MGKTYDELRHEEKLHENRVGLAIGTLIATVIISIVLIIGIGSQVGDNNDTKFQVACVNNGNLFLYNTGNKAYECANRDTAAVDALRAKVKEAIGE